MPGEIVQKIYESSKPNPDCVVDWDRVMAQVDNDCEFLLASVRLFLESEYLVDWNQLKHAVIQKNASMVKQTAHSLKGAFACFGGVAICRIAERLEQMGCKGDVTGAMTMLQDMDYEIQRFTKFYKARIEQADK